MIWLAVVDTVFLVSSCLTFSLPRLSQTYADQYWAYLLPYTLPIAQVGDRPVVLKMFSEMGNLTCFSSLLLSALPFS